MSLQSYERPVGSPTLPNYPHNPNPPYLPHHSIPSPMPDNSRFASVLMKALERKNLDGFDYLEFKQSVGKLGEMGMDNDTAIQSAFATGSTVGLTVEKLLKTASYYLDVLQDEKGQFMRSLEKHLADNVDSKASEGGQLKKQIANWQAQIEELNRRIEEAQKRIDQHDAQIAQARKKAEANQHGFEEALAVITSAIRQDVEDIRRVLG